MSFAHRFLLSSTQVVAFALMGSAVMESQSPAESDETQPVREITLDEITAHSPIQVVDAKMVSDVPLSSASEKYLVNYLTHHKIYDGDAWLEELEDHVKYFWQQHGYFQVDVKSTARRLSARPTDRRFEVTFTVSAGQQYKLGTINVSGAKQFTAAQIRAAFDIQEGDIFNVRRIGDGLEWLRELYDSLGFINFTAVPETHIDAQDGRVSLHLTIDEGVQFRIGEVTVLGFSPEDASRRLSQSGLISGAVFSSKLINDFIARNKAMLPSNFDPDDDVERRINERNATVDLVRIFRKPPDD